MIVEPGRRTTARAAVLWVVTLSTRLTTKVPFPQIYDVDVTKRIPHNASQVNCFRVD